MAKRNGLQMFAGLLMWVITITTTLAIAGLFTTGTTITYPILNWFPQVVHTFLGWTLIGLVLISAVLYLIDTFS